MQPASSEQQWNQELLRSGRIEQLARTMSADAASAQGAVDNATIDRFRKTLPSLDQLGSTLKYGNAIVVSSRGSEVIGLIRNVITHKGKGRNELLRRLVDLGRHGVPEALNFSGFVYEHGIFGAPRDSRLAHDYYTAAAAHRYQPAMLNLAMMAYLGTGQPVHENVALDLIHQAAAVGQEQSHRVCGLASFMEYRRGDQQAALRFGASCHSALAAIPNAAFNTQIPLNRRIKMLRDSIGTGAKDGYRWLETITQRAGPDPAHVYCKYRLVNRTRTGPGRFDLKALARTCYESTTTTSSNTAADSAIKAIVTFVETEQRALERMRVNDRFRHFASVPYLPFNLNDVQLFEPVMKESK